MLELSRKITLSKDLLRDVSLGPTALILLGIRRVGGLGTNPADTQT